jgi:hypothetical protein
MNLAIIACPQCSTQNLNQSKFCSHCGCSIQAALSQPRSNPTLETVEVETNRTGAADAPAVNQSWQATAKPASSNEVGTMTLISIGCALIGLVALGPISSIPGAILAYMDLSKAKAENKPVPSLTTLALWGNIGVSFLSMFCCTGLLGMMLLSAGGGY